MTDHLDVTPRTADADGDGDQAYDRRSNPQRRTVLKAAGLLGLGGTAAVLAACSSSAETPAAPVSSEAAAPSSAASSPSASASASSASPSGAASSSSAPSGPSVDRASVPEGGGVILENADYVITQPSSGQFKAFSKICTHQGCPVSEISTTIDCKCHGSKFSITDGSVVTGPAKEPLAESKTTVSGGKVYVDA